MSDIDLAHGGTKYGLAALEGILAEMRNAPQGTRNDTLNRLALRMGALVAGGELTATAAECLKTAAAEAGLTSEEIAKTYNSGFTAGLKSPAKAPEKARNGHHGNGNGQAHTDTKADGKTPPEAANAPAPDPDTAIAPETVSEDWLAQCIVGCEGKNIRFDSVRKIAFFWDGHRWTADRTNRLLNLAREYCRRYNPHGKVSLGKHSTAAGVMKLVAADQRVAVVPEIFDQDDLNIGCPHGVAEMKSGIFRPGRREDYITMCAGADPAENEDCPTWLSFVDQCTKHDQHYAAFLKRLFGYLLTGKINLHIFVIIFGVGGGGKTTFLDTLRASMGSYARTVDLALFMEGSDSERRYALASVSGRRLITAAESRPAQKLNSAFVKNITGESELEARQIYGAPFQFQRKFKPILATNHRPRIPYVDSGLARRLILLPFDNVPEKADEGLGEKLQSELSGILRWGLNGFLEFQMEGLNPPSVVQVSTKRYLWDEDTLQQWLDEYCAVAPQYEGSATALRKSWNDFQERQGVTPDDLTKAKGFCAMMASKGFISGHKKKGNVFIGLRLKELEDDLNR